MTIEDVHRIFQGHIIAGLIKESQGGIRKMAEVGVWRSKTMRRVLRDCSEAITEYWAIDPWVPLHSGQGTHRERKIDAVEWEAQYLGACRLMVQWFPQIRVVRAASPEVVEIFPDGYFDLVFIDADHHYDSLMVDIAAWLPKVCPGGILSGHDYRHNRFPGVTQAVDEAFGGSAEVAEADMWVKRL